MPYNPHAYLEYEEEDEEADSRNLFGSDDNNDDDPPVDVSDRIASSSRVNPATPIRPGASTSTHIASPGRRTENAVASSSRQHTAHSVQPATAWKPPAVQLAGRPAHIDRSKELLRRITERKMSIPDRGPPPLLQICQAVIEANATRIWDVGDVGYGLVEDLLKRMPMEQLAEVEANSPSLKKQTDWLWESFLIRDYAAAWEKARYKAGELRTSGWRRKYAEAMEEAEERKANAGKRLAERYQQIESERHAKRVVMVDKVVLPQGAKQPRGIPWRGLGPKPGTTNLGGGKAAGLIAKAKADTQRSRLAMIHASGRGVMPSPSLYQPKPMSTTTSRQAVTSVSLSGQPRSIGGLRIPPPRPVTARRLDVPTGQKNSRDSTSPIMPATQKRSDNGNGKWSIPLAGHHTPSAANPIPGSYRTAEHISKESAIKSSAAAKSPERFKLEVNKTPELGLLPKTVVPEFSAPKQMRQSIDFFDQPIISPYRPTVTVARLPRVTNSATGKRKRDSDPGLVSPETAPAKSTRTAPPGTTANKYDPTLTQSENGVIDLTDDFGDQRSFAVNLPVKAVQQTKFSRPAAHGLHSAGEDTAKIESVLFRRKAKVKSRPVNYAA